MNSLEINYLWVVRLGECVCTIEVMEHIFSFGVLPFPSLLFSALVGVAEFDVEILLIAEVIL